MPHNLIILCALGFIGIVLVLCAFGWIVVTAVEFAGSCEADEDAWEDRPYGDVPALPDSFSFHSAPIAREAQHDHVD